MGREKQSGFTIVELLIVIVVIAILAAITIVSYSGITRSADESAVKSATANAQRAFEVRRIESGTYPLDQAEAEVVFQVGGDRQMQYTYTEATESYLLTVSGSSYENCLSSTGSITEGPCAGHDSQIGYVAPEEPVASAVVTDGLIGWWPFNGDADDDSSSGATGTLYGDPVSTTGQNGDANGAYDLDGVDDYIDLGDTLNDLAVPFTYSAWIYFDSAPTSTEKAILSSDSASAYSGATLFVRSTQPLHLLMGDGGPAGSNNRRSLYNTTTNAITAGSWYHVVAVAETTTSGALYINNTSMSVSSSGSGATMVSSGSYNALVGRMYNTGGSALEYTDFKIDDLRVYNRALSTSEVDELFNAGAY